MADAESLTVRVRVNPANAEITNDPDYAANRERERATREEVHLSHLNYLISKGELELPSGPVESVGDLMVRSPELLARAMSERDMTILAALGGYGLVGISDGLNFHGAEIVWIPDESVRVGGFEIEADNPAEVGEIIGQLARLRSV